MAYFAPYIDATGFHMPLYLDILSNLITQAQTIFGTDTYLGIDSQDYQFISALSSSIYDAFLTCQIVYNSIGPSTALGTALDVVNKINGISRIPATFSTCIVTLTGVANTVINNGVVADTNNINWKLSSPITIGSSGSVSALATCSIAGPIIANSGQITTIVTPTYGWTSIANTVTSSIGSLTETDGQFRARQALSVAISSATLLDGLKAEIAGIIGVSRFNTYENSTSAVNAQGLPANSITCVVEGGADVDIANAIYLKRNLGCLTNGTTSITIQDSYNQLTPISFYRPTYVDIDVVVNVKKLNGYTTQTGINIQNAIVNLLNSFSIGSNLAISGLWGASLSAMASLNNPLFSITSLSAAVHGGSQGTTDIALLFNQVLRGNIAYITVNAS